MFLKHLALVKADLTGLAEAMPAEAYDFRPAAGAFDGTRTFGEQVKHTATVIFLTAAIVLEERSPYAPGTGDNGPDDVQGKAQVVEYLARALAYAERALASVTEANRLDRVSTYFGAQTREEVAAGIAYHSYNHYGQMVVYARLNGVIPPSSRT